MSLSSREILLVQDSINDILPIAQNTGEFFYDQLFSIAPHLRPLFQENIKPQARKIMTVMIHIIANLDNMANISDELTQLAERHLDYQVEPAHYDYIGQALFKTIQNKIGDRWNVELATAWGKAYGNICDIMLKVHDKS